jgi:hypothetical protein
MHFKVTQKKILVEFLEYSIIFSSRRKYTTLVQVPADSSIAVALTPIKRREDCLYETDDDYYSKVD